MKTAFRVILACLLATPVLTSCHEDSDYLYRTYYTYCNESTAEITVASFFAYYIGLSGQDSVFVIPVNGEHTLLLVMEGSCVPPFYWKGHPSAIDSLVVTNGKYRVVQRFKDNEGLYDLTNYELVSEGRHEKSYLYTFTDSFFDQGEPLSP